MSPSGWMMIVTLLAIAGCPSHEQMVRHANARNLAARADALVRAAAREGSRFEPVPAAIDPRAPEQAGELVSTQKALPIYRLADGELAIGSYVECDTPSPEYRFYRHAWGVRVVVIYPDVDRIVRCTGMRRFWRLGKPKEVEVAWEKYRFDEPCRPMDEELKPRWLLGRH